MVNTLIVLKNIEKSHLSRFANNDKKLKAHLCILSTSVIDLGSSMML